MRNIGSTVGISAAVAILARSTQVNTSYLGEHFSIYDVQRWQATGVVPGANVGTAQLMGEIERQAAAIAYSNDFHVLALATIVVLPLVWLLKPPRGKPHSAGRRRGDGVGQSTLRANTEARIRSDSQFILRRCRSNGLFLPSPGARHESRRRRRIVSLTLRRTVRHDLERSRHGCACRTSTPTTRIS